MAGRPGGADSAPGPLELPRSTPAGRQRRGGVGRRLGAGGATRMALPWDSATSPSAPRAGPSPGLPTGPTQCSWRRHRCSGRLGGGSSTTRRLGRRLGLLYRHEITVLRPARRTSDRRRPLVALSFDEEAADSIIRSHRTCAWTAESGQLRDRGEDHGGGWEHSRVRQQTHCGSSNRERVRFYVIPIRSWPAASSSRRTPPG